MTDKQKLMEIIKERQELATESYMKFRTMKDKRAYIISNARCNLYDEILDLIEEILT